ncbi:MAG TPA: peptidase M48 [Noviherbaspirillum sp.]
MLSIVPSPRARLRILLALAPALFLAACAAPASAISPTSHTDPLRLKLHGQLHAAASIESAATSSDGELDTFLMTWIEQQRRLYRIAAPLIRHNAELCKARAQPLPGFNARNKYSYSRDFVASAASVLGLGERLRVTEVLSGSGAEKSGVRAGDSLIAVNDKPFPVGRQAEQRATILLASAMQDHASFKLELSRGGEHLTLQVPHTRGCAFGIELGNTDEINSYSDGRRVMVTRGMLDFVRSDQELAYVLAKEMAHGALVRSPRFSMAALIDSFRLQGVRRPLQPTDQPAPYTPVLDATADKLSLYMLARAGYDYEDAPEFWQRLAAQYPASTPASHTALHPSTEYRLSVMTRVIERIKEKKRLRRALLP